MLYIDQKIRVEEKPMSGSPKVVLCFCEEIPAETCYLVMSLDEAIKLATDLMKTPLIWKEMGRRHMPLM